MRIEISGGIASGKTSLAKLLASKGLDCIFEDFNANPFWETYFSDPSRFYFETELTFFLQHYHEIKISKSKKLLCDYALCQDRAYTKIGVAHSPSRLNAFNHVYEELVKEIGVPDVIIHLECKIKTLLNRIEKRGRKEEQGITGDFLEKLENNIIFELNAMKQGTKIIYVNSEEKDFLINQENKNEVIDLILGSI
jgi:deoxyadenosine/deoxycytidine kinase